MVRRIIVKYSKRKLLYVFVNSSSLRKPIDSMNKFHKHIGSVTIMKGPKRFITSLSLSLSLPFNTYVRVSICVENIGLWCFRVITRPVRSTRVSSTSGRRSFVFMAFRLCGNQIRRWCIPRTYACVHYAPHEISTTFYECL